MISILALCLLIGVAAARVVSEVPSANLPLVEGRITNGKEAGLGQFPYICELRITTPDVRFWCSGTLVSDSWILTAGHCLHNANKLTAFLGAHNIWNLEEEGQIRIDIPKLYFIVHKGYNDENLDNDIALIRLPEPVQFTDRIQPASLPGLSDVNNTYEGELVVAAGWGKVADNEPGIFPILQYIEIKVTNRKICSIIYGYDLTENRVCISTKGNKSPCHGDSGGPLIYQDGKSDYLIGIASFVSTFGCEVQIPGVYTRVAAYLPWIQEHTGLVQL